jgi:hypothetical protein
MFLMGGKLGFSGGGRAISDNLTENQRVPGCGNNLSVLGSLQNY